MVSGVSLCATDISNDLYQGFLKLSLVPRTVYSPYVINKSLLSDLMKIFLKLARLTLQCTYTNVYHSFTQKASDRTNLCLLLYIDVI